MLGLAAIIRHEPDLELSSVLQKLIERDRIQAVRLALERGLLDLDR